MIVSEEPIALQKLLQSFGRWNRDELRLCIAQGRVTVDGVVETRFAAPVDPAAQIVVDGVPATPEQTWVVLMHKPKAHITAREADEQYPGLAQYLPDDAPWLFPVGRLDAASEGALLWTNHGALGRRILHPDFGIVKRYALKLRDRLEPDDRRFALLTRGLTLQGQTLRALRVRWRELRTRATWIEIQLDEGKNREIRRLCVAAGFQIVKLRREAVGPVELRDLRPRCCRRLSDVEVQMLLRHVGLPA